MPAVEQCRSGQRPHELPFLNGKIIGGNAHTVRLNEAIAAFGKGREEITRERLPFNFAISSGWQGVALAMLAERRSDPIAAERAVAQLSIAVEVLREADHRLHAALFADELAKGRALLDQLRSH